MKKLIAMLLALTMIFALAACGSKPAEAPAAAPAADKPADAAPAAAPAAEPAKEETYELNIYHTFSATGHEEMWFQKAAEEIKAQTGGHVIINTAPDGVMGGEDEVNPQVYAGVLDMSLSGPSVWGGNCGVDAIGWSELPYVVDNYDEMTALSKVLPDLINQQLEASGESDKLICIGAMSQGIRCLLTDKDHPVHVMADCKGIKVRVPSGDVYMNTMNSFGCSAQYMSSKEVITSLNNGVINGFESDPTSIISRGQEVAFKYYITTNHIASLNLLMISTPRLAALPAEYQEIVKNVFIDYCAQEVEDRVAYEDADLQKCVDAGVEVIELTPEAFAEFKEAGTAYQQEWLKQYNCEEIVAQAKELIAAELAK